MQDAVLGVESIHSRFKNLQRTYHCMRNKVQRLLAMVKEHNLSIAFLNVALFLPQPSEQKNVIVYIIVLYK